MSARQRRTEQPPEWQEVEAESIDPATWRAIVAPPRPVEQPHPEPSVSTRAACYRVRPLSELVKVIEVSGGRVFHVCRPSSDSRCFNHKVSNVFVHRIEAATPRTHMGGGPLVDDSQRPPLTRRLDGLPPRNGGGPS